LMMREMLRVARKRVIIVCPHGLFASHRCKPLHVNRLRPRWFYRLAKKVGWHCHVKYSDWGGFPHPSFSLIHFPIEIKAVLWREKI
jgi:hypothetical protein